jgi:hypothetical protein
MKVVSAILLLRAVTWADVVNLQLLIANAPGALKIGVVD